MANTKTVSELAKHTTALNAVTFAVAYNGYFEAIKSEEKRLALTWGRMVLEQAGNLGVTDGMLSSLAPIREMVAKLEARAAA